jgi:hypothetical protein
MVLDLVVIVLSVCVGAGFTWAAMSGRYDEMKYRLSCANEDLNWYRRQYVELIERQVKDKVEDVNSLSVDDQVRLMESRSDITVNAQWLEELGQKTDSRKEGV